MTTLSRFVRAGFSVLVIISINASAALSGTRSVGPTGDYASLIAAIADIQAQTLDGALVLELQPAYVSTVETFPLTIPALNGGSAANTLTIRPASGATNLSISSTDTTAATVDLNGAQFVTIDGRPGGVGSHAGSGVGAASQLTINNNSFSGGRAVRFINEASGNALRYTTLRSANTSASSGTVVFSTTTGANGNDNNTIDHCDLRDVGIISLMPRNGLYSLGATTTTARNNSGNTVSNCNIFNFVPPTGIGFGMDAAGVRLDGGNTDWSLTGNSFYRTVGPAGADAQVRAIHINNPSGNNFTVTSNFIGGSAANTGGTAWTDVGSQLKFFRGIWLNVGATTPSSVQGNTIANMAWTNGLPLGAVLPGMWIGIYVEAGSANIGTVTGNTIGSGTGTGSILNVGGTSFGIGSTSSGTVNIANNTIGSITVRGGEASLVGIQVTAGANTISNNLVGSTTTANSLACLNSPSDQQVTGIRSSSSASASITGNTVANLYNNYGGSTEFLGGQVLGIVTSAGVNTITGNTVRNLSTTSQNTNQSVLGISDTSTAAGQTVSRNTVHSLTNDSGELPPPPVSVTGIFFTGPTSGTNVIERNLVHSLSVFSSSTLSGINGMQFAAGTFTAQNNMVRVGLKADGTSTAGAFQSRGIYDVGTDAGRNFYHNSVYVGGTQTSGAATTVAFLSIGVSNARTFQNNIFVNARSNSGTATGKHYAVSYGGTTVNPTGLTAGGNLFLASGAGGVLGLYNSADRTTLSAWQAATGQDATSLNVDPLYVNPTGTAATVDLHLQSTSPATGAGLALAAVTDDIDGDARSATAPEIGADEFPNSAPTDIALSPSSIAENNAPGATVGTLSATDPDAGQTHTFALVAGTGDTDNAAFTITGASLKLNGSADYETQNSYSIRVIATDNGSPALSYERQLTVTVTNIDEGYPDWKYAQFSPADRANPLISGPTADPNADGVPNALAYALNLDPFAYSQNAMPEALPETRSGQDYYVFTFPKDTSKPDITYIGETSPDMTTWNPQTGTVISTVGTIQTIEILLPTHGPDRFARLRIAGL